MGPGGGRADLQEVGEIGRASGRERVEFRRLLFRSSHPPDKLQVLQTANEWHATFGYPRPAGPASDEVVNNFIIVDMMAKAATDQATPEEAVAWAQKEIEPIYRKWA